MHTRRLKNIINYISEGIIFINSQGNIVEYNKVAERLLEINAQEVLSKNINDASLPKKLKQCYGDGSFVTDALLDIDGTHYIINRLLTTVPSQYAETIITIVKVSNIQRLEKFAKKMTTGVSKSTIFSFESQIAINKGQLQTVEVKLIGHSDSEDGYAHSMSIAQSFAIVIEDKSQEHMQEELIKIEHHKIEKLLAVIMPSEIKKKHDEGLDTSLQVDTGSILVATIRVNSLGHEDLVRMVNSLFQSFDSLMNEDIIRVRTCQLSFIAAVGLFTKSKTTGQIAADTALKMITNTQKIVGSPDSVSVHIGIHTGTLKCGMIGVIHPVFDIVGDTAQGAMRLSELCPPWMIHISERTYGEIKFMKYNVKELGTDRHTYLMSPNPFNSNEIQKVIQNIE